jgi:alpha-beta hydrolase superfamily lysophospholipase
MDLMKTEIIFSTKSSHSLFTRQWNINNPKANVFISHGLGEHSGRYLSIALYLNQKGYNVYAYDHLGHGQSSGVRGHIDDFDDYYNDLKCWIKKHSVEKRPNYLLGHSLGGFIATGFLIRYPSLIDACILSAPGYKKKHPPSYIKSFLGRLIAHVFPKLTLWNEINLTDICSTPSVIHDYQHDPYIHDRVSTGFFVAYLKESERIKKECFQIKTPILMLIPGEDNIVNHRCSRHYFDLMRSKNKQWNEYPHAYHEVLNESNIQKTIYLHIEKWLLKYE